MEAKREDMEMCGNYILWAKVESLSTAMNNPHRHYFATSLIQIKAKLVKEDAK